MAHYEVSLVARIPQQKNAPVFNEIGQLRFNNLSYTQDRSAIGAVQTSVDVDTLTQEQKDRVRDLRRSPVELWVYRDGELVGAGTLSNYQIMGRSLVLYAHGLLYYLRYMYVTSNLTFDNTEQFTIARRLLSQWQDQLYGNFGLQMSEGDSGVLRRRNYRAAENLNVYEVFKQLSEVIDGFDFSLNPATRTIELHHPEMGSDKSDMTIFDRRNILDGTVQVSVQEGDLASDAYGTGAIRSEGAEETVIRSHKFNQDVRRTFGKVGIAENFSDVSQQATLDGHTEALLRSRTEQLFIPTSELLPVGGVSIGSFGPGDMIQYAFDAGLGQQVVIRRVNTIRVSFSDSGSETLSVGLE